MIKVFVFDIGNVVWEFKPLYDRLFTIWASRLNKTFVEMRLDFAKSYQDIEIEKISIEDWLLSLNPNIDIKLFLSDLETVFSDEKTFTSYFFPETIKLLLKLKSQNIPLICLSNTEALIYPYFKKFIIDPYFDHSILSWQVGIRKPELGIYQKIFDFVQVQPNEVIFIDDKPENVAAAKSLGINALLFENNQKLLQDIDTYQNS
ncbi:MAG: HAD-IA family hydrolase [Candidatus Shapirobacteria bacterium]